MSTKRQQRLRASTCNGTTVEEPPPSPRQPLLPFDLVLEIVARANVATILRCAVTSKPLRRAILDQDFRRGLALRAAANGGFDPVLLLGVAFRLEVYGAARSECVVQTSQRFRLHAGLSDCFWPVASRDGLLVLRRAPTGGRLFTYYNIPPRDIVRTTELRVRNTFTGHVTVLPRNVLLRNDPHEMYPLALLAVDNAGRSCEMLVADWSLQTQTFSLKDGKWGAVRAAQLAPGHPRLYGPARNSHPAVIGRTVHWLSRPGRHPLYSADDAIVLALHADTARATTIELPQGCVSRMLGCTKSSSELLLGASADGRLRLVVAEREVISMWTLSSSSSSSENPKRWSRQVVIDRQGLDRQLAGWDVYGSIEFVGFGERSGTVLLEMCTAGLVQLNVATKEAVVLCRRWSEPRRTISQACLHEVDLASLLRAMKPF